MGTAIAKFINNLIFNLQPTRESGTEPAWTHLVSKDLQGLVKKKFYYWVLRNASNSA